MTAEASVAEAPPLVEAKSLAKAYDGRSVLARASLAVGGGDCVVLTGTNGSGKTTFLHLLAGLRRPDAGEVRWRGKPLTGAGAGAWTKARARWGVLPQRTGFPDGARVGDLVRLHARLRGSPLKRAVGWLERVGLGAREAESVGALSGGMGQRLGIALTLFHEPELVLLDEPSASLDPEWREALVCWIREAVDRGAGVVVATQLPEWLDLPARRLRCMAGRLSPDGGAPPEGP